MAGRIVFLAAHAQPRRLMDRARDVLGTTDVLVCPPEIDLRAHVKAGCEIVPAASIDDLRARARRGECVARVFSDPEDQQDVLALACAGELVEVASLEKSVLFGKRVVVTRTSEQARGTAQLLRARGAEPVVAPAIEIHPPRDPAKLTAAIPRLGEARCIVFTSANGVDCVWREIARQGGDARVFGRTRIAAIGPGTAQALEAHGLRADIVAKEHKQEGLAAEILAALAGGAERGRIVLLRAEVAREVLPSALRDAGFDVEVVAAYETRPPDRARAAALGRELEEGRIDVVTLTSSSTVENLCDALGARAAELLRRACVATIGPITSKTCAARGVRVDVEAGEYTILGLLAALESHFPPID